MKCISSPKASCSRISKVFKPSFKFFYISFSELTPKPKVVETEKTDNGKNGSFSLEDKPEFKKLLSSSPPQMSPIVPDGDPPEPEELIKAIQVITY